MDFTTSGEAVVETTGVVVVVVVKTTGIGEAEVVVVGIGASRVVVVVVGERIEGVALVEDGGWSSSPDALARFANCTVVGEGSKTGDAIPIEKGVVGEGVVIEEVITSVKGQKTTNQTKKGKKLRKEGGGKKNRRDL